MPQRSYDSRWFDKRWHVTAQMTGKSALWTAVNTVSHYGGITAVQAEEPLLWPAALVDNLAYAVMVFIAFVGATGAAMCA